MYAVKIDPKKPDKKIIILAADTIRSGGLVVFPTETVYGIAANLLDDKAITKLYDVKQRPKNKPFTVHISDVRMIEKLGCKVTTSARALIKKFWPGPLTLVLPRANKIPDVVTAGGVTVGIRWPGHPFIQAVIRECGFPLAAPSANLSGCVSPTNAGHVRKQLGGKISLMVDGGPSQIGIESTVLDLTVSPPQILRLGAIYAESLEAVAGNTACHVKAKRRVEDPASKGKADRV